MAEKKTAESAPGVVEEFRARASGLFPPEFRAHMHAARKEFYLAMRSLIDAKIESIERAEKAAQKRATRVTVE
ncbi:MAG: hypothetical protein HY675_11835 [Chloroflexi bacterium]|nr:hypothetical protein [Chloroflexota bacterium]